MEGAMTPPQQLEKLVLACQRLAGSDHVEGALSGIVYGLYDLCAASAVAVVLRDPEGDALRVKSSRGLAAQFCQQFRRRAGDPAASEIIDGQQEVFLDDCAAEPQRAARLQLGPVPGSLACVPIVTPGRSVGYLYVARPVGRPFTDDEKLWIRAFAHLGAAAVERGELLRLRDAQPMDPETHVYKFRHFCRRLSDEVERGRRLSRPTAVLLFAIDRFEAYENVHGHERAAELFAACVDVVRGALRHIDFIGRYGNHQLAACLIESTAREAAAVGRRLQESVAVCFPPEQPELRLRIGVASLVRDGQQAMDLLQEAQRDLHRSPAGAVGEAQSSGNVNG
jgi:diguanylate cyclase (GGDEF)-like protein